MSERSRPKRRRFAFSLQTLMIVVLVIGGLLGWKARRVATQRQVVAAIKEVGGSVKYDYEWGRSPSGEPIYLANPQPWAPAWLRGAFGDEYFQEVETVLLLRPKNKTFKTPPDPKIFETITRLDRVDSVTTLRYPLDDRDFARLLTMPSLREVCLLDIEVTDAGLECLEASPTIEKLQLRFKPGVATARGLAAIARQPRLRKLELINIDLPDPASLAPLAKLARLEYLRLYRSPVDDACLASLKNLTALRDLYLHDTRITAEGVDTLAKLDQLENFTMDGSKLTDAGLTKLASHPRLKNLFLIPAPLITDAGLASLAKLGSLTYLWLDQSHVTDAGIEHLKGMKLENLEISGEGVTDAGLATLQQIPTLKFLNLVGTKITAKGRAAFRKARPGVTIQGGPSDPDPED